MVSVAPSPRDPMPTRPPITPRPMPCLLPGIPLFLPFDPPRGIGRMVAAIVWVIIEGHVAPPAPEVPVAILVDRSVVAAGRTVGKRLFHRSILSNSQPNTHGLSDQGNFLPYMLSQSAARAPVGESHP